MKAVIGEIGKCSYAPGGGTVDEAAKITCGWLARHGFWMEEVVRLGKGGEETVSSMRLTCPSGMVKFDLGAPRWETPSSPVPREDAWRRMAEWLFLEGQGPSWVQETASCEPMPGWSRVEKRRFPVPKLKFSSLEEFVLRASVMEDFFAEKEPSTTVDNS